MSVANLSSDRDSAATPQLRFHSNRSLDPATAALAETPSRPSRPLHLKTFSQFGHPRELELTAHRLLIADCCLSAHPSRYTSLSHAAPARSQTAIPYWKHAAR